MIRQAWASSPGVIPDTLIIRVPAGQVVTEIEHGYNGLPAQLELIIGVTGTISEQTNLSLRKIATPEYGGHEHWSGRLRSENGDIFIKAILSNTTISQGSHNLVVFSELDNGT